MNQQEQYAIIVAGGSGTRMSSSIPKQFIKIGEQPILMHTIQAFHHYNSQLQLILVLPKNQRAWWNDLLTTYKFGISHQVVDGGESRFLSVKYGLSAIPNDTQGLVAIHDGVRPFVSSEMIARSFSEAAIFGNAIAAIELKESIRHLSSLENTHVPRAEYRLIQTPQTFSVEEIKKAFNQKERETFTDDASVLEANGGQVHLYQGEYKNIKITTPDDLLWAEAFLAQSNR